MSSKKDGRNTRALPSPSSGAEPWISGCQELALDPREPRGAVDRHQKCPSNGAGRVRLSSSAAGISRRKKPPARHIRVNCEGRACNRGKTTPSRVSGHRRILQSPEKNHGSSSSNLPNIGLIIETKTPERGPAYVDEFAMQRSPNWREVMDYKVRGM
eukprot:scaffold1724_cov341-Pavlova_lutheri.AAC.25